MQARGRTVTRLLLTAAGVPLAIWGPTWAAFGVLVLLGSVVVYRMMQGHE